jgi:hypothetical protein
MLLWAQILTGVGSKESDGEENQEMEGEKEPKEKPREKKTKKSRGLCGNRTHDLHLTRVALCQLS